MNALLLIGARVIQVKNEHSKVIKVDVNQFIQGSFNWFSAERNVDKWKDHNISSREADRAEKLLIDRTIKSLESRKITSWDKRWAKQSGTIENIY